MGWVLFVFSFALSLPSLRFAELPPTSALTSFNKCYFIILMERDAEQTQTIIENIASMFNHLPIFTIIILENGDKYSGENSVNSPMIFINSKKVKKKHPTTLWNCSNYFKETFTIRCPMEVETTELSWKYFKDKKITCSKGRFSAEN